MINISIIVNDSFYKTPTGSSIITGSSINFTSHFGATEILNNHTNIFSIVEPGIVHIKINGSDEDMKFFIFDGMISFLKNEENEATLTTNKLYDLNNITTCEKSDLIEKLKNNKILNFENIINAINGI